MILDGEMIGYEPSAGLRVSKAENLDVRSLKDGADGPQPCFYVFDLLYLNGQVLTGKPLRESHMGSSGSGYVRVGTECLTTLN